MVYALIYLSVGLLLLVFKTPIRELEDDEISKVEIQYSIRKEDPPLIRLILFRIIVSVVLTIVYPIMLFVIVKEKFNKKSKSKAVIAKPNFISQTSFFKRMITAEEAEKYNMVDIKGHKVAFGYSHKQWVNLLQEMKKGDELYEFRTPTLEHIEIAEISWEKILDVIAEVDAGYAQALR
jgi:hypothetical protein